MPGLSAFGGMAGGAAKPNRMAAAPQRTAAAPNRAALPALNAPNAFRSAAPPRTMTPRPPGPNIGLPTFAGAKPPGPLFNEARGNTGDTASSGQFGGFNAGTENRRSVNFREFGFADNRDGRGQDGVQGQPGEQTTGNTPTEVVPGSDSRGLGAHGEFNTSPQDFYSDFEAWLKQSQDTPSHWNWLLKRMNPQFTKNDPGNLGYAQLSEVLRDPYNLPEDRKKQMLEGTELAFNRADQSIRANNLSSGAGHGGVAGMASDQAKLARGSAQANNLREFEQWRQEQGDQRLRTMFFPWLQAQNAGAAAAGGVPAGGSSGTDYAEIALSLAALFV